MQRRFVLAIAVLLAAFIVTEAQVAPLANPVCNAQYAQILVQGQVMESKSVVEPVKRIKILLRSADFLWKFDEPTSRAYLTEAWKMADDRFKETGFESKKSTEKGSTVITILPDQRMEVIRAIAKRDAAWAKRLSEQMLADYEKRSTNRESFDETREIGDLLSMANENVKTNPELSRALYRRVMRYPMFYHWFFVFYTIARENPAFADSLYQETVNNYRNESPRLLLYLSAYPFGNERMFGPDKYTVNMGPQPNVRQNPALARLFFDTFFSRIATYSASVEDINQPKEKNYLAQPAYMISALNEIEPIIVQQFPDLLPRFSSARAQAASLLNADMKKELDDKERSTNGIGLDFDERIAAMEKADGDGKLTDYMILQLVTARAKTEEQFAKIEPWLQKVKDEKARSGLTNYYWFLRAQLAIKEKRWDDADKYIAKVPEVEHRALLLFDMAEIQSKNTNDVSAQFDTLNRLSKLTRSSENSVSKAQILLGLANMYEKVNHSTALDELSEAIRVTNSLKEPDIFATTIRREIRGKDFGFFASFGTPGYDLEKTFEELSKKDFEMSLGSAKSLDDKYFRTLAVLAVATNCAKNAKPEPKAKAK